MWPHDSHPARNPAGNVTPAVQLSRKLAHATGHKAHLSAHSTWSQPIRCAGNWETLRFLLSNARWWIDEYKFDGYRFDGVTSMMYHHHGLQMAFTGAPRDGLLLCGAKNRFMRHSNIGIRRFALGGAAMYIFSAHERQRNVALYVHIVCKAT